METNMTSGKPLTMLMKFMLPLLIGNTFQQLYNMADTVIVGHFVGANALAAVGSTGTIMFLILGICMGMTTGFSVLTSQRFGANDLEGTKKSVANGILLSLIIIIIMTTVSLLLTHSLLKLMNTPEDIYQDAYNYISVIFMGIACSVFYNLLSAYLRAAGNSQVPLYFLIFSAALNVLLDLLLIIVFRLGTAGAALATDISQGISAILCWIYIMKKVPTLTPERHQWKLSSTISRQQIHIGFPMALQFGITASGTIVMQSAINLFGATAVAAVTAASKLHNLLTQGFISMGQTMTPYAGQNYGVMDVARIRKGVRTALAVQFIYSITVGLIVIVGYKWTLPLFFESGVDIEAMMPYAWTYIWQCAAMYFPLSCIFIFRNSMQGCSYALLPTCCGIVEFFARLGAALLSMKLHSFNLAVGCDPIAWLAAGLFGAVAWLWCIKDLERKKLKYSVNN